MRIEKDTRDWLLLEVVFSRKACTYQAQNGHMQA
jgi:hypothetical protein